MLGLWKGVDREKVQREWAPDFLGVETSRVPSMAKLHEVADLAREFGGIVGIHHPGVDGKFRQRWPMLTSPDEGEVRIGLETVGESLDDAREVGAAYLVVHYPHPHLISPDRDYSWWGMESWRDSRFFTRLSLLEHSKRVFHRLEIMAGTAGVRLIIEMDGPDERFYTEDLWLELLEGFPGLGFCLDTGRLRALQATFDFDPVKFTRACAPHVDLVHLWNGNPGHSQHSGHYPAHPSLRPEEGWGDIEPILRALSAINDRYLLTFEHDSRLLAADGDHRVRYQRLQEVYAWTRTLMGGGKAGVPQSG